MWFIINYFSLNLEDCDRNPETERDVERSRKEKYVTEFTARFARNFLYPLDGAVSFLYFLENKNLLKCSTDESRT